MGAPVQLLDGTVIDQIAAGEVIERPANVVKELLENGIDAHAVAIAVAVEDGGRATIRVTDDGVGMSPEDAALCIERHATSKIRSFDDLVTVGTLGFRGEALPSIGAVSRMSIVTRRSDDLAGTRVSVEGGEIREIAPHGCPPGTTVEVEDLFFNVPARKKFVRARQTETSKIFEICQRTALIRPELKLIISSDGRVARRYLPACSLAERAYQVLGDADLEEILGEREGLKLEAALAPVERARPGPRHLFLYVNGRPITDRRLARAVAFAYADRLPPGHYPRGVVSLRLPAEDVDVNAHPQKTEVRFKRPAHLVDLVTRILAMRLGTTSSGDAFWEARMGPVGLGSDPTGPGTDAPTPGSTPRVSERESDYPIRTPNGLRLIAQLRDRYLLCEGEAHLYLLDRHRADQAVRYEALREAMQSGPLTPQSLLFPDRVELGAPAQSTIARYAELLRSMGFEWSPLGERSHAVRSVPPLVGSARATSLFEEAIAALEQPGDDPADRVLHALARRAAAPDGAVLDDDDARALVAGLRLDREPYAQSIVARIALPGDHG